jgi:hypothetical protein
MADFRVLSVGWIDYQTMMSAASPLLGEEADFDLGNRRMAAVTNAPAHCPLPTWVRNDGLAKFAQKHANQGKTGQGLSTKACV